MKEQENARNIAFYLDLCADRGLAANTLKTYDNALTKYYNYALSLDKSFSEIDLFDVRDYKTFLSATESKSTQNNNLSVIRSFYNTLMEYRIYDNNPVLQTFNNRLEHKTLTFVPAAEYVVIRDYFTQHSSINYVLGLELMMTSGLRVGELRQIDLFKDISYKGNRAFLKVHGKGNKQRIVPIFSAYAVKLIELLKSQHQSLLPLMLGTSTQVYTYHLDNYAKISNHYYTNHDFRRGFAVDLYSRTHDIELVRVLLGHESYNTTLMYIRDATVNVYDLPADLYYA